MKTFGEFVSHLIKWMIGMAVVCGAVYFCGPIIWAHAWAYIQAGETAKATAHAQAGALSADTTAANRQQASCSTEVAHAMDAAKAIAKASQPQVQAVGQAQPLITADQIKAMIQ